MLSSSPTAASTRSAAGSRQKTQATGAGKTLQPNIKGIDFYSRQSTSRWRRASSCSEQGVPSLVPEAAVLSGALIPADIFKVDV
jgi:hypothetical protein